MELELAYDTAIDMGLEMRERQEGMEILSSEYVNEEIMYSYDIREIAEEIRKNFTLTQAIKFLNTFTSHDKFN